LQGPRPTATRKGDPAAPAQSLTQATTFPPSRAPSAERVGVFVCVCVWLPSFPYYSPHTARWQNGPCRLARKRSAPVFCLSFARSSRFSASTAVSIPSSGPLLSAALSSSCSIRVSVAKLAPKKNNNNNSNNNSPGSIIRLRAGSCLCREARY